MYQKWVKRGLDVTLALLGLLLLFWLYGLLALLVLCKLGRPVLFRQERPGYHERIFTLYKFRTMEPGTDQDGHPLPDGVRLTRFGRFLRETSLDELPELWNILKGDMSFIGPRPLLVAYLPLYTPEQHRRHLVRPGLSGLAQVNGRNAISWEEKFAYDLAYVEGVSFPLDLRIFLRTIGAVFRREGIGANGADTALPFTGQNSG